VRGFGRALAELAYALDDLRLDGVLLFSNARGVYLGDLRLAPLFDELQRRAAVVFVHPNPSPDPSAHALGLPDTLIDFTADTTRAVAQLHYGNTFARTSDVKYIFAHAGGTVPYLAKRFGIIDKMNVIPGARGGREPAPACHTHRDARHLDHPCAAGVRRRPPRPGPRHHRLPPVRRSPRHR
jgi:6-methylsalicylate decarboxylase